MRLPRGWRESREEWRKRRCLCCSRCLVALWRRGLARRRDFQGGRGGVRALGPPCPDGCPVMSCTIVDCACGSACLRHEKEHAPFQAAMEQEPDERQSRELQAFMEMEVRAPCSDVRRRTRAGANLSPRFLVPIMRRGGKSFGACDDALLSGCHCARQEPVLTLRPLSRPSPVRRTRRPSFRPPLASSRKRALTSACRSLATSSTHQRRTASRTAPGGTWTAACSL